MARRLLRKRLRWKKTLTSQVYVQKSLFGDVKKPKTVTTPVKPVTSEPTTCKVFSKETLEAQTALKTVLAHVEKYNLPLRSNTLVNVIRDVVPGFYFKYKNVINPKEAGIHNGRSFTISAAKQEEFLVNRKTLFQGIPTCEHCGGYEGKTILFRANEFFKPWPPFCSMHCSKNSDSYKAKLAATNVERYGVPNVFQSEEIKERIKENNVLQFGVEHNSQREDMKANSVKTCMEKYGVPHAAGAAEIITRRTVTNVERYGAENVFQNKEIQTKAKETVLLKYGVDNVFKLDSMQDYAKNRMEEKYGNRQASLIPEFKEKAKQTSLKRYGFEHPSKHPDVRAKARATSLKRYGFEHNLSNPKVKAKFVATMIERYGVEHPSQSLELRGRRSVGTNKIKTATINGVTYEGLQGYEPQAIKWSVDNGYNVIHWGGNKGKIFIYPKTKSEHLYYPDLVLEKNGVTFVTEVKSDFYAGLKGDYPKRGIFFNTLKLKAQSVVESGEKFMLLLMNKDGTLQGKNYGVPKRWLLQLRMKLPLTNVKLANKLKARLKTLYRK